MIKKYLLPFLLFSFIIACSGGDAFTEEENRQETEQEESTGSGEEEEEEEEKEEEVIVLDPFTVKFQSNNADGLNFGGYTSLVVTFIYNKSVEVDAPTFSYKIKYNNATEFESSISFNKTFTSTDITMVSSFILSLSELDNYTEDVPYAIIDGMYTVLGSTYSFRDTLDVNVLNSPLVVREGEHVKFTFQEDTWDAYNITEAQKDKAVAYMDEVYEILEELMEVQPFDGEKINYLESTENPYWAYAGNPTVLNTYYVPASLNKMANDKLSFGWIHETGHNFDMPYGQDWYYEGNYTETHANIKLSYVIEQMCVEGRDCRMVSLIDSDLVTGVEFNNEYFAPKGDSYKASTRAYTTLTNDEIHALYHQVIRDTDWNTLKRFYSYYKALSESGQMTPWDDSTEEILLSYTILDKASGMDLVSLYEEWRIPLTRDDMDKLTTEYKLNDLVIRSL